MVAHGPHDKNAKERTVTGASPKGTREHKRCQARPDMCEQQKGPGAGSQKQKPEARNSMHTHFEKVCPVRGNILSLTFILHEKEQRLV